MKGLTDEGVIPETSRTNKTEHLFYEQFSHRIILNCLLKDNIWSSFMDYASGCKIRIGSVLYDIKMPPITCTPNHEDKNFGGSLVLHSGSDDIM